jgi:beta-carotene hydroxylase
MPPDPNWATFTAPASKQDELKRLLAVPWVPGPVLLCLVMVIGGTLCLDALALGGRLALHWAAVGNGLLMYFMFTVAHDAIHRSAARSQRLNDWIGRIGLLFVFPHVSLGVFRWAHIQHHRFTNGPRDPDGWLHGPWWQAPLRFLFIDLGYLIFITRHGDAVGRRHLRTTLVAAALTLAAVALLTRQGHGREVLWLWFLPSRFSLLATGFMFFWLPHVKHDVPAARDLTQASSIRLGHEWLLTPLMQGHNYHLIHHLYPAMPSNRHEAAWRLLAPELHQRNLQIQHGFAIQPVIHHAP